MGRGILGGLLSTAAGLAIVSGAQAADLPVKAKPVEYVRICSAYGAGFYYIPGTDICLRVGGAVRADYYHNAIGAFPSIAFAPPGDSGFNNRDESTHGFRGRGYWILDARQNTAYGTLRAFLNGYISWTTGTQNNPSNAINADRAFIQFAGFTFGRAASFYDFYGSTGPYANLVSYNGQTTGATGWNVLAYTAQLGNGLSATISLEDERKKPVIQDGTFDFTVGIPAGPNRRAGTKVPAIIGNIRVDQSWGSAQIMGALQQVRGTYLGDGTSAFPRTDNEWGYAVGGGFTWNNPAAPGSVFGIQASWAKGAMGYIAQTYTNHGIFNDNTSVSFGWLVDGMYGVGPDAGKLHLTEGWGFNAGYQHRFNPNWAWTIHGGYSKVEYDSLAAAAVFNCFSGTCDELKWWSLGSRLLWTPVAGLNIGLDVMYHKFDSFADGVPFGIGIPMGATRPDFTVVGTDADVWSAMLRVQRDF